MLSGHHRITRRRNIAENFNSLSRVHERFRRQTTDDRQTDDRQTERQTDGRTTTYSEHEHEFTFAKNCTRKMKLSEEETLIDLWQQKLCLYDISNQSYSNKNKKKLDMRSLERGMFPITTSIINKLFL